MNNIPICSHPYCEGAVLDILLSNQKMQLFRVGDDVEVSKPKHFTFTVNTSGTYKKQLQVVCLF